jgi:hypothetical protein
MNYLYILYFLPFFTSAQFRDTLLIVETEKWDAAGNRIYGECWTRDSDGRELSYTSNLYGYNVFSTTEYDSLGKIKLKLYFDNVGGKLSDSIQYSYSPEIQTVSQYCYAGNGDYILMTTQTKNKDQPFYISTVTYNGFFHTFSSKLADSIFYDNRGLEVERRTYDILGYNAFPMNSPVRLTNEQTRIKQPEPGSLSKRIVKKYNEGKLLLEELSYNADGQIEHVIYNSYDSLNRLIASEDYFTATPDSPLTWKYSYTQEKSLLRKQSSSNASIGYQIELYETGQKGKLLEKSSWVDDGVYVRTIYKYDEYGYLIAEEQFYSVEPVLNMNSLINDGKTFYNYARYPGFK